MTTRYMISFDEQETGHRIVYWFGSTERDRNELLEQLEADVLDTEHPLTMRAAITLAYLAASYPLSDVKPICGDSDSQA